MGPRRFLSSGPLSTVATLVHICLFFSRLCIISFRLSRTHKEPLKHSNLLQSTVFRLDIFCVSRTFLSFLAYVYSSLLISQMLIRSWSVLTPFVLVLSARLFQKTFASTIIICKAQVTTTYLSDQLVNTCITDGTRCFTRLIILSDGFRSPFLSKTKFVYILYYRQQYSLEPSSR